MEELFIESLPYKYFKAMCIALRISVDNSLILISVNILFMCSVISF